MVPRHSRSDSARESIEEVIAHQEGGIDQPPESKLARLGRGRASGHVTSRDLIRSLPARVASGLPVYVAASAAAPFSTPLEMTSTHGVAIHTDKLVTATRHSRSLILEWMRY